jgi:membrane protein required for colicin V production
MNYIDVVLAIFLLIAAFSGFRKGFIIEVASLVALILGIWGAIKFSHFMAGFLSGQFDFHANYLGVAAFVVTFLIIVIVVYALGGSSTALSMPSRSDFKPFGRPGIWCFKRGFAPQRFLGRI